MNGHTDMQSKHIPIRALRIRRHMGNDAVGRFRGTSLNIRFSVFRVPGGGLPPAYAGVRRKLTGGKSTSSPQQGHLTQQEPWLPR